MQVITLSANVGYQRSLETALRTLEADLYVMIDVDCEDPPEMIPGFVDAHDTGYDVVYGERVDRHRAPGAQGRPPTLLPDVRALADDEVLLDMAEFALLTQEVRERVIADRNSFPFIRASIGRAGYRRLAVPYKRERRIAGETHYSVVGLFKFAVAGILSSSTWLLRITVYVLPVWLAALVCRHRRRGLQRCSWPLPVMLLLSAAYIGCTASFTAIYVGRAYKDGLGRPNAFIDSRLTSVDDDLLAPVHDRAGPQRRSDERSTRRAPSSRTSASTAPPRRAPACTGPIVIGSSTDARSRVR